jgi:hypothetical protein
MSDRNKWVQKILEFSTRTEAGDSSSSLDSSAHQRTAFDHGAALRRCRYLG